MSSFPGWLKNILDKVGRQPGRRRKPRKSISLHRVRPALEQLEDRLTPAPTVSAVSPNAGPITGESNITITGTNFVGVTNVQFGTTAASFYNVMSSTSIMASAPAESYGVVDVTVTASGSTSATNSGDQFTFIQVTLTNPGSQTGTVGVAASLQLSAVAQPSGTLSYSASNLPAGLTLNTSTGLVSGTPTTSGSYLVSASATADQDTDSKSFNWTILRGTDISMSSSPASIVSGQLTSLTATISPSSGTGTPSGTVTFSQGSSTLGTGTLNGSGVATITTTGLSVSGSTVTVTYNGDTTFGKNSSNFSESVSPASTTTTVTSSANPSV